MSSSGGFSRRDTFKTHLKALHFVYPAGTKSLERNFKSGRCGGCFLFLIIMPIGYKIILKRVFVLEL